MITKIAFYLTEKGTPEIEMIHFDVITETEQNYVCASQDVTKSRIKKSIMNKITHSYPNNPEVVGYHCYTFHHRVPYMLEEIRKKVEEQTIQTIKTLKRLQENLTSKFNEVSSSQALTELVKAYTYEKTHAVIPGSNHKMELYLIKGPKGEVVASELSEELAMRRVDDLMVRMTMNPTPPRKASEKTKTSTQPAGTTKEKLKKKKLKKGSQPGASEKPKAKKRV